MRPLVLASTSRYRAALLDRLGLTFRVDAPDVDETARPGESAAAACVRLAEAKARAVAPRHPDALVIGSDQVADCDGRHVGKPGTLERAREQLAALSGRTVVFHTGVAVLDAATGRCAVERVDVSSAFRRLGRDEIESVPRARAAVRLRGLGAVGAAGHRAVRRDRDRRSDRARWACR